MLKKNILIAGVGGQGTILAGRLIAALVLREGLDVKTAETHGMAQRGGSVITHARFGEKVFSPLVTRGEGDLLLSFEKLEALRWLPYLSPQGVVIVNTQELDPLPVLTGAVAYPEGILEEIEAGAGRMIAVDALAIDPVRENPRTVNTLLLGILSTLLPFPVEKWRQTMTAEIKAELVAINMEAFEAGRRFAESDGPPRQG